MLLEHTRVLNNKMFLKSQSKKFLLRHPSFILFLKAL